MSGSLVKETVNNEKVEVTSKKKKPSLGYIPVKFCTLGKLGAPEVLHFRNYTMEEASELSRVRDDLFQQKLVEMLNRMIYEEDFDCSDLTEEEMIEVLLNIHANFWSKNIEGYRYYLDQELPSDKKNSSENIAHATINISNLNVIDLPEEFKEPISITTPEGVQYKFKLLRVGDKINIQKKIEQEFSSKEKGYEAVKLQFIENPSLRASDIKDPDLIQKFLEYSEIVQEKEAKFLLYTEYAKLLSVKDSNGEKKFNDLEEKISEGKKIDLSVWSTLKKGLKDIKFGVDSEVEFFSQELNKKITRRFRFRYMDFLPTLDMENSSGNALSFGV